MKALRLILTFYKTFIIASSVITISSMYLVYMYGPHIISFLFWFKVFTLGIMLVFVNSYKGKEFYYYQNLGFSKLFLWFTSIGIDLFLFFILLILMVQIR